MDLWYNIDQVAFLVYKGATRVGSLLFDGKDSNNLSWFNEVGPDDIYNHKTWILWVCRFVLVLRSHQKSQGHEI